MNFVPMATSALRQQGVCSSRNGEEKKVSLLGINLKRRDKKGGQKRDGAEH